MKIDLYDIWVNIKIFFNLPLPLSNFYHKGVKIVMWKNWYCKKCNNRFDNLDLKNRGGTPLSEINLNCPKCNSTLTVWSDEIFRAIVDKKSDDEILKIAHETMIENKLMEGRIAKQKQ